MTAHSAREQTDAKQLNSTTNSAKLMLHSAVASLFSLPKSCKIIKVPDIEDAHGIHVISVETRNPKSS